jgi:hypothetical protein
MPSNREFRSNKGFSDLVPLGRMTRRVSGRHSDLGNQGFSLRTELGLSHRPSLRRRCRCKPRPQGGPKTVFVQSKRIESSYCNLRSRVYCLLSSNIGSELRSFS